MKDSIERWNVDGSALGMSVATYLIPRFLRLRLLDIRAWIDYKDHAEITEGPGSGIRGDGIIPEVRYVL